MAGFGLDLSQSSADHNGKLETYVVTDAHATLLAPGDAVRITGSSLNGVATADAAAASQSVTGIIAGVVPNYIGEALSETGLPALTEGQINCHVDPMLNFIVPVTGGNLASTDVGSNIDLDATAATKSGGLTVSNMAVDGTSVATTDTLPFRIVGLAPNEDGVVNGSLARVRINNSTLKTGVTGV